MLLVTQLSSYDNILELNTHLYNLGMFDIIKLAVGEINTIIRTGQPSQQFHREIFRYKSDIAQPTRVLEYKVLSQLATAICPPSSTIRGSLQLIDIRYGRRLMELRLDIISECPWAVTSEEIMKGVMNAYVKDLPG